MKVGIGRTVLTNSARFFHEALFAVEDMATLTKDYSSAIRAFAEPVGSIIGFFLENSGRRHSLATLWRDKRNFRKAP